MHDTCQVTPQSSTGSRRSSSARDNLYERFEASLRTPKRRDEEIDGEICMKGLKPGCDNPKSDEKIDGWRKAGKLKAMEEPSFVGAVLKGIPASIKGEGKSALELQAELRKKQKRDAAEKALNKGLKTKALRDEREARKAERAAKKSLHEGQPTKAKRMKKQLQEDREVAPDELQEDRMQHTNTHRCQSNCMHACM